MRAPSIMLIAGEASGDAHAAGLVEAIRRQWEGSREGAGCSQPVFFGAGGPRMAGAGVRLAEDMTAHSVFGLSEALRKISHFRCLGRRLLDLAFREQPDVVVLVDFGGFNLRFAAALRRRLNRTRGLFKNWYPRLVYFISPQVWASRPGRADKLARDMDMLLSIFPFEKAWYERRNPGFPVEFVGHPLVDRFRSEDSGNPHSQSSRPLVLLLPGSRKQEIRRHLPVLAKAVERLHSLLAIRVVMVVPTEELFRLADSLVPLKRVFSVGEIETKGGIQCVVGDAGELMAQADLALTKSGSVTLECAFYRLPAVVIYRVAWLTWWIARCIVNIPFAAMPNLLAGKRVYPELLQGMGTPEAIAEEAFSLLRSSKRRAGMLRDLDAAIETLGVPGACDRAARCLIPMMVKRSRMQ